MVQYMITKCYHLDRNNQFDRICELHHDPDHGVGVPGFNQRKVAQLQPRLRVLPPKVVTRWEKGPYGLSGRSVPKRGEPCGAR